MFPWEWDLGIPKQTNRLGCRTLPAMTQGGLLAIIGGSQLFELVRE